MICEAFKRFSRFSNEIERHLNKENLRLDKLYRLAPDLTESGYKENSIQKFC